MTDPQLLAAFATRKDQPAFAELVRRHIDWVYSLAHRLAPAAAEDITQAVFILVAQKAPLLTAHTHFNGWLFRATRYCAANALKQQAARRRHEQEAAAMRAEQSPPESCPLWQEIAPHLDAALARLNAPDREALLLKFYQNKTAAEVAASFHISEEAAKKRLQRALDRLRTSLATATTANASAFAALLSTNVTHPAPITLAPAVIATKTTAATTLAKAAAHTMWWAQAKIAATLLIAAAVAGTASYKIVTHVQTPATPPALVTTPISAPSPAPTTPPDFDVLYEKAPPSTPDLTMTLGPNTFAVKAIIRFDANNKPTALDNRGRPLDPTTLSLTATPSPPGATSFGERLLIQLDPAPTRYDIDRLRIFNHATRTHISNILVRPIPGQSALELRALPGTLPPKIDLWLAAASYDPANTPTILAPTLTSTAKLGAATISFLDIRDGSWNYAASHFTSLSGDAGEATSLQLQSNARLPDRYQIAAIAKDGRKNISDFFVTFYAGPGSIMQFPLGLDQIDHFELRLNSRHPPFYFDGVPLPPVATPFTADNAVPAPIIIKATGDQADLPSGATVEFAGIAHHPANGEWWGLDGSPVDGPRTKSNGNVYGDNNSVTREFFARAFGPKRSYDILWDLDPGGGYTSTSDGKTTRATVLLPKDGNFKACLGIAGPWRTLQEIPVSQLPASIDIWPGTIAPLRQEGDDLILSMNLLPTPGNVRFILIGNNGKELRETGSSSRNEEKLPPWGTELFHATYRNLHLSDVRSLRIETRQEEFAEFDHIPMEPR